MTPPEYILDKRWETICCATKVNNGPGILIDGPDFGEWLRQFDPATTTTVTFNALFDNCVLAWRYGFVPANMLCTMSMARALHGHELERHNLKTVAAHLGLGQKGDTIHSVIGMNRNGIHVAGLWKTYCEYALQDNNLNYLIFVKLAKSFPVAERKLMDMVLRTAVTPRFMLDQRLLRQHISDTKAEKHQLLLSAFPELSENLTDVADVMAVSEQDAVRAMAKAQLMSTLKFKELLEGLGVAIKTKPSPSDPTKEIPALAKSDGFMAELLAHDDVRVQALAAARVGFKSTIEESRSGTLLRVAELPWATYADGSPRLHFGGGTLPIPLRYGGAHTHRLSGDWGMNMQNLPTLRSNAKSKLRLAMTAPTGWKVVTIDLGQIECRISASLCRATTLLDQFAKKLDPYAKLATALFGFEVDRKVHKVEGFIGKTGILGLGYGCGDERFFYMVTTMARAMGLDISKIWNEKLAAKAVKTYRRVHAPMAAGWKVLDQALELAWTFGNNIPFGPCMIYRGRVTFPGMLELKYANPRLVNHEYLYDYGRLKDIKLYGAKMLENITQGLARLVVMNAALRIYDRTGRQFWGRFVSQAHDELVYIVPDNEVDTFKTMILEEMCRRPSWASDLPLAADVGCGQSYGEAK